MAQSVWDRHEPWTFDDLDRLDGLPVEGWRYEIVDGTLEMSPPPAVRHEAVAYRLGRALDAALPESAVCFGPVGVELGASHRVPDLVVVDRATLADPAPRLHAEQVHIAIEIVSPTSRTTDRITKPAQYAAHGIPAYWRVETDNVVGVTAYALRDGATAYTEVGTWREGETLEVEQPFALRVAIDDLVP
ncbi:Uma2 family endonuclease [Nocardioides marinquilinus]|uniref:Uma2 family endonuclease n=1 Tax=Nocardioides marinquilinus TaxID=1210400 RepID=A0ABP9Q458_9ACTN